MPKHSLEDLYPSENAIAVRLREIVDRLIKYKCYPPIEELNQIVADSNKLFPELAGLTIRMLVDVINNLYLNV